MKFKRPIHCKIYTPIMLRNPQDFFMRVHHYCDHFSDMLPEKCGFWSPLKISFTPEMIEEHCKEFLADSCKHVSDLKAKQGEN